MKNASGLEFLLTWPKIHCIHWRSEVLHQRHQHHWRRHQLLSLQNPLYSWCRSPPLSLSLSLSFSLCISFSVSYFNLERKRCWGACNILFHNLQIMLLDGHFLYFVYCNGFVNYVLTFQFLTAINTRLLLWFCEIWRNRVRILLLFKNFGL